MEISLCGLAFDLVDFKVAVSGASFKAKLGPGSGFGQTWARAMFDALCGSLSAIWSEIVSSAFG